MTTRDRGLLISGPKLAEVRKDYLLTQEQLQAKTVEVGAKDGAEISLGSIKRWEPQDAVRMDTSSLKLLALAFGMSPFDLRERIAVDDVRLKRAAKNAGPKRRRKS